MIESEEPNQFIRENNFFIHLILIMIQISIQQFIVPQLQGYSNLFEVQFFNCLWIILVSQIVILLTQLSYFNFDQKDFRHEDVKYLKCLNNTIVPSIYAMKSEIKKQQNILNLLSCTNLIEFLGQFISNPENFICDQIDIIIFQLYLSLNGLISNEDLNIIIKQFNNYENFEMLNDYIKIFTIEDLKNKMSELRYQFLNQIVQVYNENIEIKNSYAHFLLKLKKVETEQQKIRKKYLIFQIDNQIWNLEDRDIKNSKNIKFKGSNTIINNSTTKQQFNSTYLNRLANYIKSSQKQDLNIDNILGNLQFRGIRKNKNIVISQKNEFNNLSLDIIDIQEIIENKLNIEKQLINNNDQKCRMNSQNLNFQARFAPDKNEITINEKIRRKCKEFSKDIPYFYNLIKDSKRMSLVFRNMKELGIQIKSLMQVFGNELNKEFLSNNGWKIKIIQIKNGFKGENNLSNKQSDLKIIFESQNSFIDLSIIFELQCNLELPIKFKVSDHILQDQNRYQENIQLMENKVMKQDYFESNYRYILQIIKYFIYICAFVVIIVCSTYTIIQQLNDQKNIVCQKGNKECYQSCIDRIKIVEIYQPDQFYSGSPKQLDCLFFYKNQESLLSNEENFIYASKFQFMDEEINIKSKRLHKELELINTQSQDEFCLRNDQVIVFCLDYHKNYSINDFSNIINLKIDGKHYYQKDKYLKFQTNYDTGLNLEEINQNETIKDFLIDQFMTCILTFSNNLQCSNLNRYYLKIFVNKNNNLGILDNYGYLYIASSDYLGQELIYNNINQIQSAFIYCVIKLSNKVICHQNNPEMYTPEQSKFNNIDISVSDHTVCSLKLDYQIECWGSNIFGQTEIDSQLKFTFIHTINSLTCGILETLKMICQGLNFIDSEKYNDINTIAFNQLNMFIQTNSKSLIRIENINENDEIITEDIWLIDIKCSITDICYNYYVIGLVCMSLQESEQINIPEEFIQSRFQHPDIYRICTINMQQQTKCMGYFYFDSSPEFIDVYNMNEVSKFAYMINTDDTFFVKSLYLYAIQYKLPFEYSIEDRGYDFLLLLESQICQINIGETDIQCVESINKKQSLIYSLKNKLLDFQKGAYFFCFQSENQNLECFYDNFVKINYLEILDQKVFKQSINYQRVCIINFILKLQCVEILSNGNVNLEKSIQISQKDQIN